MVDLFYIRHSKYRIYATFKWLLNMIFKKLNRKTEFVGSDPAYDNMISSLIYGMESMYNLEEYNDETYYNPYKIEYFLYGICEIKYILNEITTYTSFLKSAEKKLDELMNEKSLNFKAQTDLEQVIGKISRAKGELNINLE